MHPYILVVDDFPDGLDMLSEYLAHRGFTVETASRGQEALDIAWARPPRIVLMDLRMPGMNGEEAIRRLKLDPRTKDVIVVAVTGNAVLAHEAVALAAGADAFVAKPFDLRLFANALANVMTEGRTALNQLRPATLGQDARPDRP